MYVLAFIYSPLEILIIFIMLIEGETRDMERCERCKMETDKGSIWCSHCGAKTREVNSAYKRDLEKQQNNIINSEEKKRVESKNRNKGYK